MNNPQDSNAKNLYISSFLFGIKDRLIASFFIVFLLRLNATNFQITLYQILTASVGAIALLFVSNKIDSSKKSFIKSIFFDRYGFLVFSLTLFFANNPLIIIILFAIYSMNYTIAGVLTPNYLKESIPQEKWGKVFSRNKIFLIVSSIISLILIGKFLDFFNFMFPYNFAIMFLVCAVIYITSIKFLKRIDVLEANENKEEKKVNEKLTKLEVFKCVDRNIFLMVLVYSPIYMITPIWSIYHVTKLGFTNFQIAMLSVMYFIGGLLMLPYWGRLLDKYFNKKLFKLCTFLMAMIPIVYIIHDSYYYLLGVQFFMGIIVNGFDVILQNNLMTNSKKQKYDYAYISNYQILQSINTIIFPAVGVLIYSQVGAISTFLFIGMIRLITSLIVMLGMRTDENMILQKIDANK